MHCIIQYHTVLTYSTFHSFYFANGNLSFRFLRSNQ